MNKCSDLAAAEKVMRDRDIRALNDLQVWERT